MWSLQDKLLLEPYSRPRDVVYLVVAPENDFVLGHVKSYFKELSCMYEQCRMGKHQVFTTKLRDGIMRIGKNNASIVHDEPTSEWFKLIGEIFHLGWEAQMQSVQIVVTLPTF